MRIRSALGRRKPQDDVAVALAGGGRAEPVDDAAPARRALALSPASTSFSEARGPMRPTRFFSPSSCSQIPPTSSLAGSECAHVSHHVPVATSSQSRHIRMLASVIGGPGGAQSCAHSPRRCSLGGRPYRYRWRRLPSRALFRRPLDRKALLLERCVAPGSQYLVHTGLVALPWARSQSSRSRSSRKVMTSLPAE